MDDKNNKSIMCKVTDLCKKSNLNILNLTENNPLTASLGAQVTCMVN